MLIVRYEHGTIYMTARESKIWCAGRDLTPVMTNVKWFAAVLQIR